MNSNIVKPKPLAIHELAVGARDPEASWQRAESLRGREFYGEPPTIEQLLGSTVLTVTESSEIRPLELTV